MTQKRKYLDFIINLSNDEMEKMKTIDDFFGTWRTKNTYYQDCAISKTEAVNILHDDTIEKKPLDLLNYPNAITLSLTLTENDNGKT